VPTEPINLSWEEYRYHLTHELSRMSGILESLDLKVDDIQRAQAEAKGSAKTWGSVTGFAVVALVEAVKAIASAMFGHPK